MSEIDSRHFRTRSAFMPRPPRMLHFDVTTGAVHCPACGYRLHDLDVTTWTLDADALPVPSTTCSECGTPIVPEVLRQHLRLNPGAPHWRHLRRLSLRRFVVAYVSALTMGLLAIRAGVPPESSLLALIVVFPCGIVIPLMRDAWTRRPDRRQRRGAAFVITLPALPIAVLITGVLALPFDEGVGLGIMGAAIGLVICPGFPLAFLWLRIEQLAPLECDALAREALERTAPRAPEDEP